MPKLNPEEVVWVGSKEDEIILKDLITGPEERLDRKLPPGNRPAVLLNWMRNNPDSDLVQWLRTFENTGG
jgi:hypothetical protein